MKYEQPRRSLTLTALYRTATGDAATHQRTIGAILERHIDPRRKKWIRQQLAGECYNAIARGEHLTAATVRSAVLSAFEAVRKAAHHEPRYNKRGRASTAARAIGAK